MAGKRNSTITRTKPTNSSRSTDAKTDELTVIPGTRRRRKRHSFLRVLVRLIIVAALIAGGIYVWKNWDEIAPESMVIWLNDKLAGGQKGDGFPVEITGSSVLNMTQSQEGLSLLTDTSFVMFNSHGGELVRRQHGFSNPILKTAGKWSLIAEAGGSRLRVETRSSTTAEMTVKNHIIGAAMGNNGYFALATNSSHGYTSEVVVYNRRKEEIYHWYSTELTVVDVAFSPDGKSMAVAGIMASSGTMKSSILFFNFNKKEPVAQYDDMDLLICAVKFFPGGTLAAVGDQALWVINKSGTIHQKHSYDKKKITGFAIGDNEVSVVLRDFGRTEKNELMTVNPSGDKAYTVSLDGAFRSIAPCQSGMLLLTSEYIYRTDVSGICFSGNVVRDGRIISALGNKAVILGLTSLDEYATNP